jgi:hypothetical protein
MKKEETKFIEKFIKHLPEVIYVEKTFNPLRRGTPDLYIEGPRDIMWVECKWIPKPWTESVAEICDSASWPLQKKWLQRAYHKGVQSAVLVGVGNNEQAYVLNPYYFKFNPANNKLCAIIEAAEWVIECLTY